MTLVRRLYDMAVNEGNVQAIKLLLDRERPTPNHHEMPRDDIPMGVIRTTPEGTTRTTRNT